MLFCVTSFRFFRLPIRGFGAAFIASISLLNAASLMASPAGFEPLSVTLQPQVVQGPIPAWETGKILIEPTSDSVQIPVPSLASQDEIGSLALTVLFQDHGDGGPIVEWQTKEGHRALLSAGLGETGVALGLNARTLLISQSLALDGGTLRVSFAGRFARLISVTLRPARDIGVAALGASFNPALIGENEPILMGEEVSGADVMPALGDSTEGNIVHAELSTLPRQLDGLDSDGVMEFIIPISSESQKIAASLLRTEVSGLDPESWIEVSVNGESLGALGMAPFALNSPSVLFSAAGRLQFAGWRSASLVIPARLWKSGENSVILTLRRVAGDAGNSLFVRKAKIDLLFAQGAGSLRTSTSPSPPTETLSTGSLYGNPSPSLFRSSFPAPLSQ